MNARTAYDQKIAALEELIQITSILVQKESDLANVVSVNWGHVGSLGHVETELENIIRFLAGIEDDEPVPDISAFLPPIEDEDDEPEVFDLVGYLNDGCCDEMFRPL